MKMKYIAMLLLLSTVAAHSYGDNHMIHDQFTLSRAELEIIIENEKEEIQKAILSKPELFLENVAYMLDQPEELFYLADKNHAVTKDQGPQSTVRPYDYGISVTRKEREVSALIIEDLKRLTDAAASEGLDIVFASGYRPYEYQEMLYNRYVKEMGQEAADRVSARPGTSQHQLGTAVDFGTITDEYALTDEGKWLKEHAGDYGFSLSYPEGLEHVTGYKWECWHYRYISVQGIAMQKDFFLDVQQYLMEFWDNHREDFLLARR